MGTTTEYMREYRARYGGSAPADKARRQADRAAAKWVLHTHPELYADFLTQARLSLGLSIEQGPSGIFTSGPRGPRQPRRTPNVV